MMFLRYYKRMAAGDWMVPLYAAIDGFADLKRLGKAGFTVSFAPSAMHKCSVSDPLVLAEDDLAASYFRLVVCLLTERCASMMQHCCSYPMMLAGILSEDQEKANVCF